MGTWREPGAVVSEPESGRLLREQATTAPIETTFTVEPVGADTCDVTIATQMVHRGGNGGGLERLATAAFPRRVYRAELALLDQVARRRTYPPGLPVAPRVSQQATRRVLSVARDFRRAA